MDLDKELEKLEKKSNESYDIKGNEYMSSFPDYQEQNNLHNNNGEKTELEKMAEEAFQVVNDDLELGKNYNGRIKKIYLSDGSIINMHYKKIIIVYEINDNGIQRIVTDEYSFGGDYDQWYLEQLVSFVKKINGLYFGDINFKTYDTIVDSLQFLVGADVTLYQYLTKKETRKNNVTVHGTFDRNNININKVDEDVC